MTETQRAYQAYLESEHWRLLRTAAFRQLGRKCSRCPATCRLQVHHLRYRWPWTASTTGDLVILCRACHEREHGIKPVPKPTPRMPKAKFLRMRFERKVRSRRQSKVALQIQKRKRKRAASAKRVKRVVRSGSFIVDDGRLIYSPR